MNAVISGGSKGIGRAIAFKFAQEGFNIAVCARNKKPLNDLEQELKSQFPTIEVISFDCDVSQKSAILKFAEHIKNKWDTVDVLVNNAGTFIPGEIHKEKEGILEQLINTNLYSAYHLTRALIDMMIANKSGHIFNICSTASITAYANSGSYCISKFALLGFSKVLREEMKKRGIRVTAVLPGATLTDSWAKTNLPENRFMKPKDIASVIYNAYSLSKQTDVEQICLRPVLGDI